MLNLISHKRNKILLSLITITTLLGGLSISSCRNKEVTTYYLTITYYIQDLSYKNRVTSIEEGTIVNPLNYKLDDKVLNTTLFVFSSIPSESFKMDKTYTIRIDYRINPEYII